MPFGDDCQPAAEAGGHGFLNIVFTRALRTNARRRIRIASCDADRSAMATLTPDDGSYLNEICLRMLPCDIVFNGRVFACLLDVLLPSDVNSSTARPQPRNRKPSDGVGSQPIVTSGSLPLVYLDASGVRLFVPRESPGEGTGNGKTDHGCAAAETADVCIVQFGSLTVVPQAVNPLPRLVVNKDLYARAMQAGITNQPGSDIEDRQYQLDLLGFSLSTGCWSRFVSGANRSGMFDESAANQNPALAWNMLPKMR